MTVVAWMLFALAMILVPISVWASLAALGLCVGCALIRDWRKARLSSK